MENLPFTYADITILVVLLVSGLLALARGFVKEMLHILAWIGAAVIAVRAFPFAQPYVAQYLQPDLLANLATTAGIFVVSLIVLVFVFSTIAKRVRESEIGMIDRSLGFLFGLARGALVVALAYLVLMQFLPTDKDEQPRWVTASMSLPYVEQSAKLLTTVAPEVFEATLNTIEDAGDAAKTMIEDGSVEALVRPAPTSEKTSETGYGEASRREMDRMIESKRK
ncbi:MAG: CvpA family protein [Alphaproteobacteria bacterium]|jgi:membrane protein required for colicin V production|nr:CvpA family protein [Alphaproteobacteria bacterium]